MEAVLASRARTVVRRMIRYALACREGHAFESWFASSDAYEALRADGFVTCPRCGAAEVSKQIMAPRIARTDRAARSSPEEASPARAPAPPAAAQPVALLSEPERALRAMIRAVREHVTATAEHVGPAFASQARRMQSGEIEHRPIYGEATPLEVRELVEEGIAFHPLPALPDEHN